MATQLVFEGQVCEASEVLPRVKDLPAHRAEDLSLADVFLVRGRNDHDTAVPEQPIYAVERLPEQPVRHVLDYLGHYDDVEQPAVVGADYPNKAVVTRKFLQQRVAASQRGLV